MPILAPVAAIDMRRSLIIFLVVLALGIGAAGAAPAAHAAIGDACSPDSDTVCDSATSYCSYSTNTCVPNSQMADDAAKTNAAATDGSNNPTAYKSDSTDSAYDGIMIKIMQLFAWLVGIAALTLNYAMYYTVVKMGTFVNNLSAVGVAWRILRDLANIMLIFGFLGSGIAIILNVDKYGFGTKLLPKLLIAAVLINFSLFVSEVMIDGTNLVATEVYTQINGGTIPIPSALTTANEGISNKIMNQLGLQTIYGNGTVNTEIFKGGNPWIIGFMGVLLFITTAFVMFSLAFILIARFVVLIFLILVSPVAFAGWAVPWLEFRMNRWWDNFTKQIITAPVLMLLLYVALAIITDAQFLTGFGGKPDWTGYITGSSGGITGFASMILSFLVAMGLLLVVVIKAKSMSAAGAKLATQSAGKLTFGLSARMGRTAVGWPANAAARYLRTTKLARVPIVGTGLVRGVDRLATASFDVRGSKVASNLKGYVEAGAAQKGGYRAEVKARTEARTKYASELRGAEFTKEDREFLKKAEEDRKTAENYYKEIQDKHENAVKEQEKLKTELARLEEETKNIPAWEMSPETSYKMENLRQSIAGNEPVLAELNGTLDKAEKDLKAKTSAVSEEALAKQLEQRHGERTKEAQRAYAKNLELGYLGLDEHSWFNRYINFAANTDAAKKIRSNAKMSGTEKQLQAFREALEKAAGGGEKKEEKEEKQKEPST